MNLWVYLNNEYEVLWQCIVYSRAEKEITKYQNGYDVAQTMHTVAFTNVINTIDHESTKFNPLSFQCECRWSWKLRIEHDK